MNITLLTDLVQWAIDSANGGTVENPPQIDAYTTPDGEPLKILHNQKHWHCGTGACLAGGAVLAAGADPIMLDVRDRFSYLANPVEEIGAEWVADECVTVAGETRNISDYAREVLGLDEYEAHRLFDGGNHLSDIVARARMIAEDHGETLELHGYPLED